MDPKDLANNMLPSFVEILLGAPIYMLARRYNLKESTAAFLVGVVGAALCVATILISGKPNALKIVVQLSVITAALILWLHVLYSTWKDAHRLNAKGERENGLKSPAVVGTNIRTVSTVADDVDQDWDTSNPLRRLMHPYVLSCSLKGCVVRIHMIVVNVHSTAKAFRVPDGIVEFFRRTPDGGARHLASLGMSIPAISVPGRATDFEVPPWEPKSVSITQAQQMLEAHREGRLEVLVSLNCVVTRSNGSEDVERFGFMPRFETDQQVSSG